MQNRDYRRIITALFFSALPYRRKFLNYFKEFIKNVYISEEPWKDNYHLIKYFFKKKLIESAKYKTLTFLEKFDFLPEMIIFFNDKEYPELLKEIYDPPIVLFGKSSNQSYINLNEYDSVSIVGTRKPHFISLKAADRIVELISLSENAKNFIEKISMLNENQYELFKNPIKEKKLGKMLTISGFARGIDSRVHEASLFFNVPTVAILGSGIEEISPKKNYFLFERAIEENKNFIFLSEFFPNFKADKYTLPLRNRIISGMSFYLFIIQAGIKSGALISADYAIHENREIFCFDHSYFDLYGGNEGIRKLIAEGANPIQLLL